MTNTGMDQDIFDQFIKQLERYVRERLIPAEREVIESDRIPDAILAEMREMGLFGLTIPEQYGGAGMHISQYARTINVLSYAMPAFRSIISINIGMVCSALTTVCNCPRCAHRPAGSHFVRAPTGARL